MSNSIPRCQTETILQVRYIDQILHGITNFLMNYHCNTLQYVRYIAEITPRNTTRTKQDIQ